MHLKILIGVLILGIASASPKAEPKPIPKPNAKASPQFFQGYLGAQPNYFPGASNYFGQGFNPQPILGQDASGYYGQRFAPSGYQSTFGNTFAGQGAYSQASVGNYYQTPQATTGNYYQHAQVPASNYYQYPQVPSSNYYQPTQVPALNYYQPPQLPTANQYQSPQVPASDTFQPSQLIPVPVGYPGGSAQSVQPVLQPSGFSTQSEQPAQQPSGSLAQSAQQVLQSSGFSTQSVQPVLQPSGFSTQSEQPVLQPSGPSAQSAQPVLQSNGFSAQSLPSLNYYGAARLWPKALISPVGSPSPVPDVLARAYYAVSTPSPLVVSTPNQSPLSTQSPDPLSQQKLIPVPVKVDSGNSFYNAVSQIPFGGSTPAPYLANYQQSSSSAPYDQRYFQSTNQPGYSFSTTSAPYLANQQPTSPRYPINYQSSPAPFQLNNQQFTPSTPAQANYQSTTTPPAQPTYQQQSTLGPYQGNNLLPGVLSRSPFVDFQQQPTGSPYVAQNQQQSVSPFGPNYQSTASPYFQGIPVPVAYPQSQFEVQPTQPTPVTSDQPTSVNLNPSYPSVPVTSKPITILPTNPTPGKEVSITENTFIPIPTKPSPASKTKATIIKSEYSGTVSPQYNHIPLVSASYKYSTPIPFLDESAGKLSHGFSNAPAKAYASYYPSTAVSHVNFKSLGNSYSY